MQTPYIPKLDFSNYYNGSETSRVRFVEALGSAFCDSGFAVITNHQVDLTQLKELKEKFQELFALSGRIRHKYERPEIDYQRGYTSGGVETAKGAKSADLKAFWQTGRVFSKIDPYRERYPFNSLVVEVAGFNRVNDDFFNEMDKFGQHLLKPIAEFLGLDVDYFHQFVHNGNSILRGINYYPIENPDALTEDAIASGAHEDICFLTLLVGRHAQGLEVLTRDNEWLKIEAQPDDLVVNVGDMLQRLTNNKLKSPTHRVINGNLDDIQNSRFSVPFFVHPRRDMNLRCLESCINPANPKAYEYITAGAYLDERLTEIGVKK